MSNAKKKTNFFKSMLARFIRIDDIHDTQIIKKPSEKLSTDEEIQSNIDEEIRRIKSNFPGTYG